jgi:hypothetical protein
VRSFMQALCILTLAGCGSSPSSNSSAGVLNPGPNPNSLLVLDPTPDLVVNGQRPRLVTAVGYDASGRQVFGPDEEEYDESLEFHGLPDETTRVELNYLRAPGFSLAHHSEAVDFVRQDRVALQGISPRLLSGPRDTFTVRIDNQSAYPDDEVFVSVNGQERNETHYYFLRFGPNDQNRTEPFGAKARFEEYSQPLSSLKREGEHSYSFQCPRENLVSGRIYLSFGRKLQGIGLNDPANPRSLALPAPSGVPDGQTLWEFMELSATSPASTPQNYTLFANTSVVDFFSIGLGMTMSVERSGQTVNQTVGFVNDARNQVLAAFEAASTPSEFRNYVRKDGSSAILRVLGPNQGVALNPTGPLSRFLDSAIDAGWAHYATQALNIPDTIPTHTFGYRYTGVPIVNNILSMTCTGKPAADVGQGNFESLNETSNLPKPSSRIIFFCDDDSAAPEPFRNTWKNLGSQGHKRLCSLLSSALNRGVFENYSDWGTAAKFYSRADGKYNHYSKIMHNFALQGKVYGFGYDDVFGQDPTLSAPLDDVNQVVITVPPVPRI